MKRFLALPQSIRFLVITLITALLVIGMGLILGSMMPVPRSNPVVADTPSLAPANSPAAARTPLETPRQAPPQVPSQALEAPPSSPSFPLSAQPDVPPDIARSNPVTPLFGHLPYAENDLSRIEPVGRFVRDTYERDETLDYEAVQAFQAMLAAAKAEGIALMPISGFRSIADQKTLFDKQIQRQGSEEAAARLSAPPGYSEHHTGYAIDIADVDQPDADLKFSFQDTNAYRWLVANAYKFGFEQSFPQGNWQGVSYEPWHWRYVLSDRAAQIFAVAKGGG
jgi:zinc D-Ala-D-Ala carboxypeptidase